MVASAFQIVEINLVSAQDLEPVSKSMHTYAVVWLHPDRKLLTRVDQDGDTNPTWNEKLLFRVADEFLNSDTSAIMIEIYASSWLRDTLIGTVRVVISNFLPFSSSRNEGKSKMRLVALQVRRPSGRPQGIINVGVTCLDSTLRSMPLDSEPSASAVGYWDLMEVKTKKKSNPQSPRDEKTQRTINPVIRFEHSQSERSGLDGYAVKMSSISADSELAALKKGGNALRSDVVPSLSVAAAAIAKELHEDNDIESSIMGDWTKKSSGEELIKTKIARWWMELPPISDIEYQEFGSSPRRRKQRRRRSTRSRLLSCFGNAYGCEFSFTCGGGMKKKMIGDSKVHLISASEITFDESHVRD